MKTQAANVHNKLMAPKMMTARNRKPTGSSVVFMVVAMLRISPISSGGSTKKSSSSSFGVPSWRGTRRPTDSRLDRRAVIELFRFFFIRRSSRLPHQLQVQNEPRQLRVAADRLRVVQHL